MKLKEYNFSILIIAVILSLSGLRANAAVPAVQTALLNNHAGSPEDPRNIKLQITLPESYSRTSFTSEDFNIFIYPQALNIATGRHPEYQAGKILLWQQGNKLFLDIRRLPHQRSGGEHTLYLEINKNNHPIYKHELTDKIIYESDEADVVLIIDSSLSMHRNDPHQDRLRAARAFVDLARTDRRIRNIGIISFNNRPSIVAGMTPVRNTRRLHAAIDSIRANGQTDIGAALEAGYELINEADSRRKAVVLLTDGKNESSTYQEQHACFTQNDIPVYCVGLSSQADNKLLEQIADDTGGAFFKAPSNNELLGIYQRISTVISRRQVIFNKKIPNNRNRLSVPVDGSIKDISFMLNAGMNEAVFKLVSPAGKEYEVSPTKDANFSEIRLTRPETGLWTVLIGNRLAKHELELNVTGSTSLYLDSFPPLQSEGAIWLSSTLAVDGETIENANIRVISIRGSIKLFDDGKHNDGAAADGVYTCKLPIEHEFDLNLLLRAWGSRQQPYIRQTSAGILKHQTEIFKEPEINYSLQASSELNIPDTYAGTITTGKINITYSGLPRGLNATFTELKNSVYLIKPENIELTTKTVAEDSQELAVRLHIPADIPAGSYTGSMNLTTSETELDVPLALNIIDPKLHIQSATTDLGYLKEGEEKTCTLSLLLQAARAEKLQIKPENPECKINYDPNRSILPEQPEEVNFTFTALHAEPGEEQKQTITIITGDTEQSITLEYCIAPQGRKLSTMLLAHEMSLPEVSQKLTTSLPAHEMTLPEITPAAPRITPAPKKIQPKPEQPVIVTATTENTPPLTIATTKVIHNSQEEGFLIIMIIVATIALCIILLILRRLAQHRMLRIALLSATLHLPLIAFIASYIIVTGSTIVPQKKAPEVNMVLCSSTPANTYIAQNTPALKAMNRGSEPEPAPAITTPHDTSDEVIAASALDASSAQPAFKPEKKINPSLAGDIIIQRHTSENTPPESNRITPVNLAASTPELPARTMDSETSSNIQQELSSLHQPAAPIAEIFKNTTNTETATENPAATSNADALTEIVENEPTIDEEIENILRSTETTEIIAQKTETLNNHRTDSTTTLEEIDDLTIPQPDTITESTISQQPALSRDLAEEITQASKLKELAQRTPPAEDPEKLLTSIDHTAPIEADTTYDLAIPSDNLPEEITDLGDDIFTENTGEDSIITEATPRPNQEISIPDPLELPVENINEIPGVGENGLCLDFAAINSGTDLTRTSDAKEVSTTNPVNPPATPEIDDMSLDEIMLEDEYNQIPANNTEANDDIPDIAEIDIPEEDTLLNPIAPDNRPKVIAAIDNLDLSIDRKLHRLTGMTTELGKVTGDIKRNTEPEESKETTRLPQQPDLESILPQERTESTNTLTSIPELPANNPQQLQLEGDLTPETAELSSEMSLAQVPVIQEETVNITNAPKRLSTSFNPDTSLLKIPANLQKDTGITTDSAINQVSLNIGLLTPESTLESALAHSERINVINLDNSSQMYGDLLSCQLVITTRNDFSPAELELLKEYLTSGGYLWLQNNGIPRELQSIGKISRISPDNRIFNSVYKIDSNDIIFAEELSSSAKKRIIATGCRNSRIMIPILSNIFSILFGTPERDSSAQTQPATEDYTSYIWQNFSGIAQKSLGWNGPKWGNTVNTCIAPDGADGEALMIRINPGRENITSVNYIIPDHEGRRIDLSEKKAIILDIYNASKKYIDISLGLTTESHTSGWDEFETEKLPLKAGWNKNICIPLHNFRSRRDPRGGYTHTLQAADNCARVSLYFSNIRDGGNFLVDNIRWAE